MSVPHKFPVGTKLRVRYPWPEDAPDDIQNLNPLFMEGIEGTITCYVVKHEAEGDGEHLPPYYTLSPYTHAMMGTTPIGEWLDEMRAHLAAGTTPGTLNLLAYRELVAAEFGRLHIEQEVGEDFVEFFLAE